jgi:hypothetical protein
MKQASLLLLLLPTQTLGFVAPSSSTSISKPAFAKALYSSPFSDTPSPLEEAPDASSLSPYDAYENGITNEIVTKDTAPGTGTIISENGDVLTVALKGTVVQTEKEFLNNEDYAFTLGKGETFPGFNAGLLGVKVGTKRFIKVPPNKAYGQKGAKGIPPMADLLFEIEVKAIARGPVERFVASVGLDRLAGFSLMFLFLAISPMLPS